MRQGVRGGSLASGLRRLWKGREPREPFREPVAVEDDGGGAGLNEAPEWALVWRALRELSGFDRGVVYNVPRWAAPEPQWPGSTIYLRSTPAWRSYLAARRRVDYGELKPILALRPLSDAERLLVVDWGTSYANTFLLIEPRDLACDLTDPVNPVYRRVEAAAGALLRSRAVDDAEGARWIGNTALGGLLRAAFGTWTYWSGTFGSKRSRSVELAAGGAGDTLADLLAQELPVRFPQGAFDLALADLYRRESELFTRLTPQARIPFRTRLGLPILYDPRCVDRALRRLVNEGRARVARYDLDGVREYGPDRPIPESMTDAEFEQLQL